MLHLIIIATFAMSCSSRKQAKDNLPYIDIRKNYPQKEIILTDIADVSYLYLNSKSDDYLYTGPIRFISENTIVVLDISSGSVLFFSKDGNPISRFNRYGRGYQEYPVKNFPLFYDETEDDVFISYSGYQIYSSTGKYKRQINLPHNVVSVVDFDGQSFFVCCDPMQSSFRIEWTELMPQSDNHLTYYRISKTDGAVLDSMVFPCKNVDLTNRNRRYTRSTFKYIEHCTDGFLLSPPAADTIFLYGKDESITPIFCKIPLVSVNDYPFVILTGFVDTGRYQFMVVQALYNLDDMAKFGAASQFLSEASKYYFRDKQTGNIFRQKMTLPEYEGKEFFITAQNTLFNGKETLSYIELDLIELKQAYKENKLSGKLKELVATLKKDSNNVYVIASLK